MDLAIHLFCDSLFLFPFFFFFPTKQENPITETVKTKQTFSKDTTNMASTKELIEMEATYAAHNYHPLPCVIDHSDGVFVWDVEGKKYYDFLSAYSALNQGHNHPKIINAMCEQARKCALTSRAFYNSEFPRYAKFLTEYLSLIHI